ncbi:MAG: hypothetical protein FWC97_07250 [Treponema sp.]|nr:hypothetical protein [Treponema sp.]
MFEILYKITGIEELQKTLNENCFDVESDILGWFAFYVNGNEYGDYLYDPSRPNADGWMRITDWFVNLILAYRELNRSSYVLIDDIDSYIAWIELRKINDMVKISTIKAEKKDGIFCELRLTPFNHFEYYTWYDQPVKLNEIQSELTKKASLYISELQTINIKLLGNKKVAELVELISFLERDRKECLSPN